MRRISIAVLAVTALFAAIPAAAEEPPDERIWVPGIEEPGLEIEVIEVVAEVATDETTIDKTSLDKTMAGDFTTIPTQRITTLPRPQFTPAVIYFLPELGSGLPWVDTNRVFRLERTTYRLPDDRPSYYEVEIDNDTVLAYGIVDIPELSGAADPQLGSIPARFIDPQERAIAGVHFSVNFGGVGARNSPG